MSEGPTIGDWTQYGWIPDGASSFPAMVRLRNAAWMVYYEPGTVVQRVRAENAKLRELVRDYERCTVHADCSMCEYDGKLSTHCPFSPCFPDADELCELGVEVDG